MEPVSLTARWTAAARALEGRRADRLFDDPLAEMLAGPEGFEIQERMCAGSVPGWAAGFAVRTRFFDEFLLGETSGRSRPQVVLLAAGMDARAYRLPWPQGTRLFEVDRPDVLEQKERLIAAAGARPPGCARVAVGVDLARSWASDLRQAGFDARSPSVWLAEGLFVYLDAPAVLDLVREVGALAAAGSCFGADLANGAYLTSPYLKGFADRMAQSGAPWRFATDEPESLLPERHWEAHVTDGSEAGANYGRRPFPRLPRWYPGLPRIWLLTARRR